MRRSATPFQRTRRPSDAGTGATQLTCCSSGDLAAHRMSDGCLGRHRIESWETNCGHGPGSHCMLGRRRYGTRVADSHKVVKASLRQPPTQWCGKVTRLCQRTGKGLSSWGAYGARGFHCPRIAGQNKGAHSSVPQDSRCAGSPARVASVVVRCCDGGRERPPGCATCIVRAIRGCSR